MTFDIRLGREPQAVVDATVPSLVEGMVASGITAQDPTLWGPGAEADAAVRLGWVNAVAAAAPLVEEIERLRSAFLRSGVDRFVLAGMGGSSLAPEVITTTAGVDLIILDSTAPAQVLAALSGPSGDAVERTALIVSSKSGTTAETDAARRAFEAGFSDLGIDPADRIVVVTGPGSALHAEAESLGYRTFTADPDVGGRYSALTAFGLVPSGLAGAPLRGLLAEADETLLEVAVDHPGNPALVLGSAIAGRLNGTRRDKLALFLDDASIAGLPDWIEQLVAESTGKNGTGILPVVVLPVSPEVEDPFDDVQLVRIVDDVDDHGVFGDHDDEIIISATLGAHFIVWEYAVAIACRLLGVNPFDQPDVESAKVATRTLLDQPAMPTSPDFVDAGIEVRTTSAGLASASTLREALSQLWAQVPADGYVSVHAYVDRLATPQLSGVRELIAAAAARPTTFGWGPRFLHSTGQYHKGGPATGVFLQILEATETDLEIPGRTHTFGQLIAAQASGDAAVLRSLGRPVVTITLTDPQTDVLSLFEAIDAPLPPLPGDIPS